MDDQSQRRRYAILVNVGAALLFGMMGVIWLIKAGDEGGLLADETRSDAWRPLAFCAVALLLTILLAARVAAAGLIGALLYAALAVAAIASFAADGKLGRKGNIGFCIALLAVAWMHLKIWLDRRPSAGS